MEKLKQLFIDAPLAKGARVTLPAALAHRLSRVLRLKENDMVALFNGRHGLFTARLNNNGCTMVEVGERLKSQPQTPATTLMVGLAKRDAMTSAYRQATELGITDIQPVQTDFCVSDKVNVERVTAVLVEAAEQCERLDVPTLHPLNPLSKAVTTFKGRLFWCAEHVGGSWSGPIPQPGDGILVGPEGGFSPIERDWLAKQPNVTPVGLGNTILRVDTAVVAACTLFREKSGR